MAEAGLPDVEMTQDFGVAIHTGPPRAIVERLNREINALLALADMKALILKNGAIAQKCTPKKWGAYFLKKRALATSIAKRHGFEIQD